MTLSRQGAVSAPHQDDLPASATGEPTAGVREALPRLSVFETGEALPPVHDETRVPTPDEMQLITELARGLHLYGAPAHRIEHMIEAVAQRMGYPLYVLCTPTSVSLAFGPIDRQLLRLIRISPGSVDLARLSRLYEFADEIVNREVSAQTGAERIAAIHNLRDEIPEWARLACHGISSFAASIFFQGGVSDVAAATTLGVVVGAISLLGRRSQKLGTVLDFFSAVVATVLATLWASWIAPVAIFETVLSALISLLPGFTLTVAMTELATRNLVSGTARFASAAITFLQLGVGVVIGSQLANAIQLSPEYGPPLQPLTALMPLAVLVGGVAIALLYHARLRDLPMIALVSTIGFMGARAGAAALGASVGGFVGALLLGVMGNWYGRRYQQPTLTVTAPALTLLVPGSVGFRSISALMHNDVVGGVDTLITMLVVAASLVAGLLTANVLVRPPASE